MKKNVILQEKFAAEGDGRAKEAPRRKSGIRKQERAGPEAGALRSGRGEFERGPRPWTPIQNRGGTVRGGVRKQALAPQLTVAGDTQTASAAAARAAAAARRAASFAAAAKDHAANAAATRAGAAADVKKALEIKFPGRTIVTLQELAAAIRCSRQHVADLIESGALKAIDISAPGANARSWRITVPEWVRFMEARQ